MHLAERHLRRYQRPGIAIEDLRQVALLGLVGAVERFDPDFGVAFATFARRTVEGELKRHLRDRTWTVRPVRRQQELFLTVRRGQDELSQCLGRSPTVDELARWSGETVEDILHAMEAGDARFARSFDQPVGQADLVLGDSIGEDDASFGQAEVRHVVEELLGTLSGRERLVIELRFFHDLDQSDIAARLDLSQSYVSRLINRTLQGMRKHLDPRDAESAR
jgi:RNA polymerase sigma-B factor